MESWRLRWGKSTVAAIFTLAMCVIATPVVADHNGDAGRFVESLADRAVQSLTDGDISRPERVHRFRTLFNEHFAVEEIGKWVLGRYWRQATPAEQAEYLRLFEDYIVASYVDRFAAYTGEKLRIIKVLTEDGGGIIVFSEIFAMNGEQTAARVDWRIEEKDHHFKVVDLVAEGVSMSVTLRSDFASIVRREGDLSGLLKVLRTKTATLEASP
ncbi:MlaC/ttg2D family ABC transporter substrate-binding protein [Shumkonia mesophila]|uniref:MlaC/ttg2D family ABC transporter substrate-binding protein n=1 Tax=Shumkonia mesophila TaxID=2838854 RepID=UPI00293516FF|nr:ABC transporter substrate-binding protein [Shumkonia mesophila]